MTCRLRPLFPLLSALLLAGPCLAAGTATLSTDRADGTYQVGQVARWTVAWEGDGAPPPARFRVLHGQRVEVAAGAVRFDGTTAHVETPCTAPGTSLLEVTWPGSEGRDARATAGIVIAPERIAPSAPRPDDFRAFWEAKIAELRTVPADPQLEPADSGVPGVDYWKVGMNHVRDGRIYAQLARPREGAKHPALLIVQWAGVYPLQRTWVTDRAAEGWLVLNLMPHEVPIDKPEEYYDELKISGPLKNYWAIGNDDRERSYYLRMYLSCIRGADYLTGREDWDGRTLVVMGGSQGGMQALVTASLHPKVTAALAAVPAGCDMLGPIANRKGGWPQWYDWVTGRDERRVRETSRYFDVANFAADIRCPVLIGVGLRDEVCPPEGIFAMANQIRAPKEIVILAAAGHGDENGTHAAYNKRAHDEWLPALRQGAAPPVKR